MSLQMTGKGTQIYFIPNEDYLEVLDISDEDIFDDRMDERGIEWNDRLFPVRNILNFNKQNIQKRLNDVYQSKTDISLLNFKDRLNINDNYSISKSEFKKTILPSLFGWTSTQDPRAQANALLLLQLILFNDWKLGKSELNESALKAGLISKLISINETTNENEIKELISNFFLLLCFVVSDDNKRVKKLLLSNDRIVIDSTIRAVNETQNESLIKDSFLLFQFYIYYSQKFETISPVLSTLIKFLKHTDKTIVSQTCYTLLIFSQSFQRSRNVLIESQVCKKLIDLWVESDEEEVIKPIFAIMKSLLVRFNAYKNQLLSKELNILEIIPKLVDSNETNAVFASEIIKMIAMKPIHAKKFGSIEQIQLIIKFKTICFINNLLENHSSFEVKSSALNAIFVVVYNSNLEQLNQLAELGCLKALCSQLGSEDKSHLFLTVLTIAIFLMEEAKDILKNQYHYPNPNESLTTFAQIIEDCGGFDRLKRLNRVRVEREDKYIKAIEEWQQNIKQRPVSQNNSKPEKYVLSENERMIEEILVLSFGLETRQKSRKPGKVVMTEKKALISCCDCKNRLANTDIFSCGHVSFCKKCGSNAVHKVYSQDPKVCPVEKCEKKIPAADCPWFMFKAKTFKTYSEIQTQVEREVDQDICK